MIVALQLKMEPRSFSLMDSNSFDFEFAWNLRRVSSFEQLTDRIDLQERSGHLCSEKKKLLRLLDVGRWSLF